MPQNDTFIEYPSVHNTFTTNEYGVFQYGEYEEWSVLAGQEKRSCLGEYKTLEEAQEAHPGAIWTDGSGFVDHPIPDTAPPWFDPTAIGESWDGE